MRHLLRGVLAAPWTAAVIVVSLAVGIGVNTTVFSWIQAVVVRPLPGVVDGGGFYFVEPRAASGSYPGVSWREYQDLAPRLQSLRGLLAFRMAPLSVGDPGRAERAFGMLVSGNYFDALGLEPALGRFLAPDEAARPGGVPVAVVSYDYWQAHLEADPAVVGRVLRVNQSEVTIVGVAPDGFQGTVVGLQHDLWLPATMAPVLMAGSAELEDRSQRGYTVMGRLRATASLADLRGEAAGTLAELQRDFPSVYGGQQYEVLPFWDSPRGPQRMFAGALATLQALMLLVLLAVCGNVANLVLARASTRVREMGVRLALGAGPGRVAGMMLVESLALSVAAAALGAVLAVWGTTALRAMPAYGAFPVRFQTSVDLAGLGFALALGIGCGLVFGSAPAWQLARVAPQHALRSGARQSGRSLLRDVLMGVQVALAVLVLVAAGLFFKTFADTKLSDPHFRVDGVLLSSYDLSGRSADRAFPTRFAADLLDRLRAIPSIEAAAISSSVPLDLHGLPSRAFTVEGRGETTAPETAVSNIVTPGYFKALGIAIVAGGDFADLRDTAAPPQVLVNRAFVARYLDGAEPIGRLVRSRDVDYAVAGVVADSTYDSFGEPPLPAIFFSYRDRPSTIAEVHVVGRPGAESTLAGPVERAIHELDASLPVYNVRTMAEHIDKNLILRKIPARLFLVVAPLLIALVAMGIYAVVAYSVSHRTGEIGVRVALGATADGVVRQIVRESLLVIGFGASCGWVLAAMIDLHLFRGGAADMPVLVGVPAFLMAVAAVSSWLPARRASLVDPVDALRQA